MNELIKPFVGVSRYFYLTEKEMITLLRNAKKKKYGFLETAFEVEEVLVEAGVCPDPTSNRRLDRGTYYHVRFEFLVSKPT